jgi:hypothetical protein
LGGRYLQRAAVAASMVTAVAVAPGCGGTRRVAGGAPEAGASTAAAAPAAQPAVVAGVAAPVSSSSAAPAPGSGPAGPTAGALPAPTPGSSPAVAPPTAPSPEVAVSIEATVRPALLDAARAADRRQQFARAVAKISSQLGAPISAGQALRDMPCGGWSGPDCPNLTLGLEIVKACAPVVASFHRKRTPEIAAVLAEAVTIHAVWHDAYGYVRKVKKKGPGYTYAGCLFSRCDAGDMKNGQVDGVLYQVGRLLGTATGPACGPECTLGDL